MPERAALTEAAARLPAGARVRERCPMAGITTFRIGGPATLVVDCPDPGLVPSCLSALHKARIPAVVVGHGSNILVSDHGVAGAVVRFASDDPGWRPGPGGTVEVNAGAPLDRVVQLSVEAGRDGLVFCSGIPGTLAGAIVGNAGAWGRQIAEVLTEVELLSKAGASSWCPADQLGFSYRDSNLKHTGDVVLRARLRLADGDRAALQAERARILAIRAEKHPDWRQEPCVGSFFRNVEPTSAAERRRSAGWFLEQVGAKELRVGGAAVFPRHANILINRGGARADEVLALSREMQRRVEVRFGFRLVREIRLLGVFEGDPPGGDAVGFH